MAADANKLKAVKQSDQCELCGDTGFYGFHTRLLITRPGRPPSDASHWAEYPCNSCPTFHLSRRKEPSND